MKGTGARPYGLIYALCILHSALIKVRIYALFLIFLGLSTLSTSAETLILCGVVYIGPVDFGTQGGILFLR